MPVDGAALLTDLSSTLRTYVIVTDVQADAVALWSVHTHAHDASDVSPKLVPKSPQKRSGKTRLAATLARTVARPLYVSGIKPAALLRIIETRAPTLLLDEMDAAMKQDREMAEALRGIINSGFDRAGARYIMNVPIPGGGYEPPAIRCPDMRSLAVLQGFKGHGRLLGDQNRGDRERSGRCGFFLRSFRGGFHS
jgi:putative DNA primase/helicase